MNQKKPHFNISLYNYNVTGEEFIIFNFKHWNYLTEISANHLRSLGYNAKAKYPSPPVGLGAAPSDTNDIIWHTMASIPDYATPIKATLLLSKLFIRRIDRQLLRASQENKCTVHVSISYKKKIHQWNACENPENITHKIPSLLDASFFAKNFLSEKYPNLIFNTSIDVGLINTAKEDSTIIRYNLPHDSPTELNVARLKKACRYSTYPTGVKRSYSITQKTIAGRNFIKRIDRHSEYNKKHTTC